MERTLRELGVQKLLSDKSMRLSIDLPGEVKAMHEDEDKFYVEGIASTPESDRMKDIVEPMGAIFKTPMPFIWQHNHEKPVGRVTWAKPQKPGIPFRAYIPKIKEAGALKDRVDEAIQSIQYELVTSVSIGFRPIEGEYEFMDNGGVYFKKWEWYELSPVTIPANPGAVITAYKSTDPALLPASGFMEVRQFGNRPGVTGKTRKPIQLIPRGKR